MNTLDKVFEQIVKLPTIPQVVLELVEMTRDDNVELTDVIEKVRQDQALSAKVIRVANSSFYGERGRISSVERAINIVGLHTLRTTVITTGVMAAFPRVKGMEMGQYWRHGLTSAYMALELARLNGTVDMEEAFTAGLMLGLGVLLIQLQMPDEAQIIGESVSPLDLASRLEVEREVLGFTHNEVSAELLARWRFPKSICEAILYYSKSMHGSLLCKIIFVSAAYAWSKISGLGSRSLMSSLDKKMITELGLTGEWVEGHGEMIAKSVDSIVISG
ncbi:hypothetical protein BSFA1_84440 (plasmid) [Burkholderia sp. SFA1]|nr:putative signal transduction protein [Burkholderia sp. YI23]BBQ03316.1 hypothetical protein BSFA1_84440 [Burkholderia sp. SFA1]